MENIKTISPTLNSKRLFEERTKNNLPVFNAGLGENPLPSPFFLKEKLKNCCFKKEYSNIEGSTEFREILKSKYPSNMINTMVGNGLKELIFTLLFSWKEKVFIPTPCWVTYLEDLKKLSKDYYQIKCNLKSNYKLVPEILDEYLAKFNGYNSLLILNNPTNPTGAVYSEEELIKLSKIFEKYNLVVFSDEIYFNTAQSKITSLSFLYKKCIIGSSLSKDWASGGWRFGWMIFSDNLSLLHKEMIFNGSIIYSCPSDFFNDVACEAFTNENNEVHFEIQKKYFLKLSKEIETEIENSQIIQSKFEGCWYKWIDLKNYQKKLEQKNIKNSIDLAEKLAVEIGLIVVPGIYFGEDGFTFRLSIISDNLNIGIRNLIKWLS